MSLHAETSAAVHTQRAHDAEVRRCCDGRDQARPSARSGAGGAGARATHTHTLHPWKRVVKTKAIRTDKQKNGRLSRYDTVVCWYGVRGLTVTQYTYTAFRSRSSPLHSLGPAAVRSPPRRPRPERRRRRARPQAPRSRPRATPPAAPPRAAVRRRAPGGQEEGW